MKKIIILLLFVFIGYSTVAQVVNISDANFKTILLAAKSTNTIAKDLSGVYFKIDANNDLEIQVSEAMQVSYLDIPAYNVASLTGILNFKNLKYLSCQNNLLTSLNVSGLNELQNLYCNLNQLTTLDVSGAAKLEGLYCGDNKLENLNVDGLLSLEFLYCENNLISTLNAEGLAKLKIITCYNNTLTFLNLNGLTLLERVYCSKNKLTTLNVNDSVKLHILACAFNDLNTLFLKNGSIEDSIEINDNPNLQYICADESQMAFLQGLVNNYGYTGCVVNSDCFLSLENHSLNQLISIYPNPVKYILNIKNTSDVEMFSINIFNALGQLINTIPNSEKVSSLDVSYLTAGAYYMKINTNKGMSTIKLIKD